MEEGYDVPAIEAKWQARWREWGTYEVDNDDPRPHYYALCMYPYPSGQAHMGHVRNYTFGDLITRHRTMNGYAVLSPMGFDSLRAAGRERGHQDRASTLAGSPTSASRSCAGRSCASAVATTGAER